MRSAVLVAVEVVLGGSGEIEDLMRPLLPVDASSRRSWASVEIWARRASLEVSSEVQNEQFC